MRADAAALRAAVDGVDGVEEAFLSAASPGVVAFFLADHHYGDHKAYLFAIADAMKVEYDEIHRAGLVLQLDCPDLTLTRGRRGGESPDDSAACLRCTSRRSTTRRATSRPTRCACTENVIAGTDCGFASFAGSAGSAAVDPAIVWAKLGAMADGAALATAELW